MKTTSIDWSAAGEAWKAVEAQLGPICLAQTSANFARNQRLMDELVEVTAASDAHPALFNLLDCLADWVQAYEASHAPIDNAHPAEVLKHLMDANGLRQSDLKVELGGQSVVSAILGRKRSINAGQAARLAKRFGVSAAIFIASANAVSQRPDGGFEVFEEDSTTPTVLAFSRWEEFADSGYH
ncbi:hypothetical protein [Roseateles sp.]|uniref:helix-turn-helix domain-containing protein n=1 Tax=Roseateles sp. TaxID=1971397 RepID=UPI002F41730B